MKPPLTPEPPDNDDVFDAMLRAAGPRVPLPAAFHHGVWRRIEAEADAGPASRFTQWMDTVFRLLARPVPAAAAVILMAGTGHWLGSRDSGSPGKLTYIQSVSPFLNPEPQDARP